MTIIPQCIFLLLIAIAIHTEMKKNKFTINYMISNLFLIFILAWGGFFDSVFELMGRIL